MSFIQTAWVLVATIPYVLASISSQTTNGTEPGLNIYQQIQENAAQTNDRVVKYFGWIWLAIVVVLMIYYWTVCLLRHLRLLTNLSPGSAASDGSQRYFAFPNEQWAMLKRTLVYAPLFKKRHHREFRLSSVASMGSLPSRMQTLFLVGYIAVNILFCVWGINWNSNNVLEPYTDGRNRTGMLATFNMIPLFLLAGRNNPLIWLLGIGFDTYNLIHRWIGRIVVLEAIAHAAFWMAGKIAAAGTSRGWTMVSLAMHSSQMILTGTIGVVAMIIILFQTPSVVRHAFYETFLHIHIALVIVTVVTVWIHLKGLQQQSFLIGAVVCWVVERSIRFLSLIRNNYPRAHGTTRATVEALPGDAIRVTIRMAQAWRFAPGQHVYLCMPAIGMLTFHPFSIAWGEQALDMTSEKSLPLSRQDFSLESNNSQANTMSLVIRRRTGFTNALYRKAEASLTGPLITTALIEGPYGAQSLRSYGTALLFAAGIGITHQLPHVRDLVASYANGTAATRKVVLVWIIQSPEHLEWIRPWMTQILGMDRRRDVLKILLFVTRPRSTKEIHSPSSSVQMFPGRPDVTALIKKEQEKQVGAMAVSVCGTGSLSDDVRAAVRARCEVSAMDFLEESFSH